VIRVEELGVTAIKGLGLCHPEQARLEETGAVGDRDFFLVDEDLELHSVGRFGDLLTSWSRFDPTSGVLAVGRGCDVLLEDVVERGEPVRAHLWGQRFQDGYVVPGPWAALLSELAGTSLRLVRAVTPSGGQDVHPVTLVARSSVESLGREPDGRPLSVRRFRMTMVLAGADPHAEAAWSGAELEVGSARLRVGGEVPRCPAVQRRPEDGAAGVNALRMIAQSRGPRPSEEGRTLNLGVYAEVLRPGTVSVGDPVTVVG
jgi:uncharacterized protein